MNNQFMMLDDNYLRQMCGGTQF